MLIVRHDDDDDDNEQIQKFFLSHRWDSKRLHSIKSKVGDYSRG